MSPIIGITNSIKNNVLNILKERKEASSFIGLRHGEVPWDILKKYRNNPDWSYEDWESFSDIQIRTNKILNLFSSHPNGSRILVFSHASIIRSIVINILLPNVIPWQYFDLTEKMKIKPCWISNIEYSMGNFEETYSWKLLTWMS